MFRQSRLDRQASVDQHDIYPESVLSADSVFRTALPFGAPGETALTDSSFIAPSIELVAAGRAAHGPSSAQRVSVSPEDQKTTSDAYLRPSPTKRAIPKLEWPTRSDPALTNSTTKLIQELWAIVVSRALQTGFPILRTMVSMFNDPSESERKALLHILCGASGIQSLAFWDSLESDLQAWLDTLTERDRTAFITKMGLRVHWT